MQTTEILNKIINAVSTSQPNTKYTSKALNQSSNDNLRSKKPYIVIRAVESYDLENNVEAWMKEGYYVQGGVAVYEGIYYQSMILVQ